MGRWWRRSRRVGEEGWRLGGAHERAAHHDSFAARRDVRELLFDVALVDGVITLEDALALRGTALHDREIAAGRTGPQRRFLVETSRIAGFRRRAWSRLIREMLLSDVNIIHRGKYPAVSSMLRRAVAQCSLTVISNFVEHARSALAVDFVTFTTAI